MPIPGENAAVTFAGVAGQSVTVKIGPATVSQSQVSFVRPDGTPLVTPQYVFSTGKTITTSLPVSGTYTIALDPAQTYTGSITVSVS